MANEIAPENVEVYEAWNGPLYERWVNFREVVAGALVAHGEAALAHFPPPTGGRVLDVGCGLGETTVRLAELVGPEGSVLGIDVAERMIGIARDEAQRMGVENVGYVDGDAQTYPFEGPFDYAFARCGTMFFANPVAALRNVRSALAPGARLNMVVWRRKLDNDWLHRAEVVVKEFADKPEEYDEPTCGPGPFSMADADTVTDIMRFAGFEDISLHRCDEPIKIGRDLDGAVDYVMAIGPAAEVMRLWGDRIEDMRPKIEAAVREALAEFQGPDGVVAAASTWSVSGVTPAAA